MLCLCIEDSASVDRSRQQAPFPTLRRFRAATAVSQSHADVGPCWRAHRGGSKASSSWSNSATERQPCTTSTRTTWLSQAARCPAGGRHLIPVSPAAARRSVPAGRLTGCAAPLSVRPCVVSSAAGRSCGYAAVIPLKASADEDGSRVYLLRVLARRAPGGPPKASPARRRAAAERSGAALI